MIKDNFVSTINKLRLENKNSWYFWSGMVENKSIQIKGYNTWLQIFNVDGVGYSNPMERRISQFKNDLLIPFNQ